MLNKGSINAKSRAIFILALLAAIPSSHAFVDSDERSLARGAVEDVTPQQKYRTAIREAGGGYKEWLRECNQMPSADRRACIVEAKATYDREMAQAQLILRDRAPVLVPPRRS